MNSGRLLILVAIITLTGCASGKKAYERGDYYEAVMLSVSKLRQNPDHMKIQRGLEK
jgi:hypothetical protein